MLTGEEILSKLLWLPSEMGFICSRFFPFREDLFSEGTWSAGMETENHKKNVSLVNMTENYQVFSDILLTTHKFKFIGNQGK